VPISNLRTRSSEDGSDGRQSSVCQQEIAFVRTTPGPVKETTGAQQPTRLLSGTRQSHLALTPWSKTANFCPRLMKFVKRLHKNVFVLCAMAVGAFQQFTNDTERVRQPS
jgi:hypothetical protein